MKKNVIFKAFYGVFSSVFFVALPSFANQDLREVVISGSKVETPIHGVGVSISVIDNEALELGGYQNVADALRVLPGVSVSNSGGQGKSTAIRIRGEEGYRTLVIVDGIDVSDPTGTQVGPQSQHLMSSIDIDKIEVLRGPQGLMYGADAGGVVNIRTRSGAQEVHGELAMEAGTFGSRSINGYVAGGNKTADAFFSVSDSETEGFELSANSTEPFKEKDGYENTTIHAKLGLNLTEQVKADLVIRNTDSLNAFDGCWDVVESNDCVGDFEQEAIRVSLAYDLQTIQHNLGLQSVKTERRNFANNLPSFSTQGSAEKLEYMGGWSISGMYDLGWGLDLKQESIVDSAGLRYKRDQIGVFSELRMNVSNTFFVSGGFRLDDNENFGQHISFRVSTAYVQPLSNEFNLKYRSSYGTGFRAPSLSEIAYNINKGSLLPTLTEELSSGYDLGIELYSSNGFSAQLAYFNQMIEDEIAFDLIAWTGYEQKIGISHSKGAELSLEAVVVKNVIVFGNYTYNDTLTRDDVQRVRRPRNIANIGVKLSSYDQRFNVLISSRYVRDAIDEYYDDTILKTVIAELDDYNVVDISARFAVVDNVTAFIRMSNVTDETYQEVTGYNSAERALYVGVKASF